MNRRLVQRSAAILFVVLACPKHVPAQAYAGDDNPSVTGHGASVIKRQPETLRLRVQMSAKAKNLKEALAKLKTQREAATTKLAKMDVVSDSVQVQNAHVDTAVSNQQRQMEAMVRQRMRQGGRKSKKAPEKLITVSANLTAEWKLKASEPEALLLEAEAIKDKVKAADLSGAKSEEERTAEEEETDEEMAEVAGMYGGDPGELKPGEPVFMYVSRLSKDEQTKAFSEAFARAKASAEQLSRSAGSDLGPLIGLSAQASPELAGAMGNYFGRYNDPMRQYLAQMVSEQSQIAEDKLGEAIGSQPDDVMMPIHVTAKFALKSSK